jgi:hypothetical protein
VIIRLSADSETVALFLGLRKVRHGRQLTADELVTMTEALDAQGATVGAWVRESVAPTARVTEAVDLLYLVASATDSGLGTDTDPGDDVVITALMSEERDPLAIDSQRSSRQAFEAVLLNESLIQEARDLVTHAAVVRQSATQGRPSALDAATVLAYVDAFRHEDLEPPPTRARAGIAGTLSQSASKVDAVLSEAVGSLEECLDLIEAELDMETAPTVVADEFVLAVDALLNANAFPDEAADVTDLRGAASAFKEVDLSDLVRRARLALSEGSHRDRRLRLMSAVPWKAVDDVSRFLGLARPVLSAADARLRTSSSGGFDVVGELTAARGAGQQLVDALTAFADQDGRP